MKYFAILLFSLLTLASCDTDSDSALGNRAASESGGLAGSYARFLPVGNYMYIVDDMNIRTLSLTNKSKPVEIDNQLIGEQIESIFHLRGNLFIGSGSGLYIYTIGTDGIPVRKGASLNDFPILPCDPVVANDSVAFVTLSSLNAATCGGFNRVNELRLYDIKDLENPQLFNSYNLTNPKGLGIDGNLLFVCDDTNGLLVYDASNPNDLQVIKHFTEFTAFDVIPDNGLLLLVQKDRITQIDYTDPQDLKVLSSIDL